MCCLYIPKFSFSSHIFTPKVYRISRNPGKTARNERILKSASRQTKSLSKDLESVGVMVLSPGVSDFLRLQEGIRQNYMNVEVDSVVVFSSIDSTLSTLSC